MNLPGPFGPAHDDRRAVGGADRAGGGKVVSHYDRAGDVPRLPQLVGEAPRELRLDRALEVLQTAAGLASTWTSWSNSTPACWKVNFASACPDTTRSDSFGLKPGQLGAVSCIGLRRAPAPAGAEVGLVEKSRNRSRLIGRLDLHGRGISASAAAAKTSAKKSRSLGEIWPQPLLDL